MEFGSTGESSWRAQENLHALSAQAVLIFELHAAAATISQPRDALCGRKVVFPLDNEAARASEARGAAKNRTALMLLDATWPVVDCYDIAIWIGRLLSKLNPPDSPFRGQRLLFWRGTQKRAPIFS